LSFWRKSAEQQKRYFSADNKINVFSGDIKRKISINPNWITGIIEAEGSIYVIICKSDRSKLGWTVQIYFSIVAQINPANIIMLEQFNCFFYDVGKINKYDNAYKLVITGYKIC